MTPPTTDTSREAVEALAAVLIDRKSCNTKFDQERAANKLVVLLAERDALRDQLAAARNEALEEAISKTALYLEYDTLRPPEAWDDDEKDHWHTGGIDHLRALLSSLKALKSTTPAPRDGDMASQAMPITFTYKNYRGEVAKRTAIPKAIWFGTTEWHPEPGWLMTAYDLVKAADRDFALADCSFAPREVTVQEAALVSPIAELLPDAVERAEKAMRKFPQPNYVISKWAEESGEVTKALVHAAESRETWENIRGELVDTLAMLHRLFVEGDEVHGLRPLRALANEEQSDG